MLLELHVKNLALIERADCGVWRGPKYSYRRDRRR